MRRKLATLSALGIAAGALLTPAAAHAAATGCRVVFSGGTSGGPAGGFVLTVLDVYNTGTAPVTGWGITFTLAPGQRISSAINSTITGTSGSVTANNLIWNPTIAPGGRVQIGFQGYHSGDTSLPTATALRGVPCSVG
jgi:acetylxylan esterase